jgi:acetyl-CoA synthetase
VKGEGIFAFMICEDGVKDPESFKKEINDLVTKVISPIAKPDKIQVVSGLPKTRSGKIMRRILRSIAAGETEDMGDVSTLLDPSVVEEIKKGNAY